jgi:hypothetical protein
MSGNERYLGIGRSTGDITVLSVFDNNSTWYVSNNIIGAHTSSINFIRFTNTGWHLLSGAGDGVVRLRARFDLGHTPLNYTLNGQSGDWDDINKQFTIG